MNISIDGEMRQGEWDFFENINANVLVLIHLYKGNTTEDFSKINFHIFGWHKTFNFMINDWTVPSKESKERKKKQISKISKYVKINRKKKTLTLHFLTSFSGLIYLDVHLQNLWSELRP